MRDPGSDVGRYLGGLDGLRGVACMAVLTAHCIGHFAPTSTPNGIAQILVQGMTVFFVLSGMLIYLPFLRAIADGGRVRLGRYARRRLMRIYPVWFVIFLICNLVLGAVYVSNALVAARPLSDAGTGRITAPGDVLLHLTLMQTFFPSQMQVGIPPSWSLTTEMTFYVALPIVALIATGRRGSRLVWALVPPLVFFAIGTVGRILLTQRFAASGLTVDEAEFGPNALAVLARSWFIYADTFALGMVIAVLFTWTEARRWERWTSSRATAVGWALVVVGGFGAVAMLHRQHWFIGLFTAVAGAGLLLLLCDPAARGRESWVSRIAAFAPFRYLGETSYSIYLWHVPMIVLVSRLGWFHTDSIPTLLGATGMVAVLSVALASITFRWVERPAMSVGR
jgi:peptidoglycan/LPS O-acetylase OafA/YrhL